MSMDFWRRLKKNKFIRTGLPMVAFVIIGSHGLTEFMKIKIKRRDDKTHMLTAEESLSFQKKVQKVIVEEEHEKIQEKLDLDHWRNVRGPRPWEDSKTVQNNSSSNQE